MRFLLKAYGLILDSNVPVPGLDRALAGEAAQVRIELSERPGSWGSPAGKFYYASDWFDDRGEPALRVWQSDSEFHLVYSQGPEFRIDRAGAWVAGAWPAGMTLEAVAYYLLGPVLGFLLRLRDTLCLHAGGAVIDGRAILFAGGCGSGKSTLAASFARAGFPVLCDDLAAIRQEAGMSHVQPGYPRVKLWPDSAAALFGESGALPVVAPEWDKRYLEISRTFAAAALPLAAIYLLRFQMDPGPPAFAPVTAREAVTSLVVNTYAYYLLDMNMRASELRSLAKLMAGVPVRSFTRPADFQQAAASIDAIVTDVRSLCTP
ncbi:MAG TPA: hypothetical protein VGH38_23965 [Bryobacteraceae bacterium]